MSFFNIKIKTKSGNDIKKKETMTTFFRVSYKNNLFTRKKTAEYTYRIMSSGGVSDPKKVLEIKNTENIKSIEDLTLKVILNMCHVLGKLSQKHDINPDFIMFMSPDLDGKRNKAWVFLKPLFSRAFYESVPITISNNILDEKQRYEIDWNKDRCEKFGIDKDDLDKLKQFVDLNPDTVFMSVDPQINPTKYGKSLGVCRALQDRMERKFEDELDY